MKTDSTGPRPTFRALSLGIFITLILAVSACGSAEQPTYKIGLLNIMSGQLRELSGIPAQQGAFLAADEINARGGVMIGGVAHRIVLVERPMENRPDAAAMTARGLINLDSVDAIVGPQTSGLAIGAAGVAEVSQVPLISPLASNPAVTADKTMIMRLAFHDSFQGHMLAKFAFDSLGVRRAAALHDAASPYGNSIVALFKETFENLGGTVVRIETFDIDGGIDYHPQLRRLVALNPDAILLPSYAFHDSVQIRQARSLGFEGRFLGPDSWDPASMVDIDDALGSVVVANWDPRVDRPESQAFVKAFTERYEVQPRTTSAATYDAVYLIAAGATRAGTTDGKAVAEAVRNLGEWKGAAATYWFEGSGDPRRGGVVFEIRKGEVALRQIVPPPN